MNDTTYPRQCNVAADGDTLTRKFDALTDRPDVVAFVIAIVTNDGQGMQLLNVEGRAVTEFIHRMKRVAP